MLSALTELVREHAVIGAIVFILIRAIAGIVAPIPGAAVDLVGIAVYGWVPALGLSEFGIALGAITSFAIARRFREPAGRRFGAIKKVNALEARLSKNESYWAWIVIRLPTNALFDYLNYAAGLTTVPFRQFLVTTMIGSFPGVLVFFY